MTTTVITREVLEKIDEKRVREVVKEVIGQGLDDEELVGFITEEIFNNKEQSLSSAKFLANTIEEHLYNFGCCEDEKDVEFTCETIIEELAQTKEEDDENNGEYVPKQEDGECVLCEREMPLTFHHLFPRTTHKKMMKKGYEKKELCVGIMVCRPCHSAIHRFIDEESMSAQYYSLEKLLEHQKVQDWIPYIAKKKAVSKEEAALYHSGKLRYSK